MWEEVMRVARTLTMLLMIYWVWRIERRVSKLERPWE